MQASHVVAKLEEAAEGKIDGLGEPMGKDKEKANGSAS